MHRVLLFVHSLNRWVVVALLVLALVRSIRAWRARGSWTGRDDVVGRLLTGALDLQLILGIGLYAVSPIVRAGWSNLAAAMDERTLQFWTFEHAPTMVI